MEKLVGTIPNMYDVAARVSYSVVNQSFGMWMRIFKYKSRVNRIKRERERVRREK